MFNPTCMPSCVKLQYIYKIGICTAILIKLNHTLFNNSLPKSKRLRRFPSMTDICPIGRYFTKNDNSGLHDTLERAQLLQKFSHDLRQFLHPPLSQHIHFANIRDNVAVITVDDASWLTGARYEAPAILKFIKQKLDLSYLSKVHFKVVFSLQAPEPPLRQRLSMSQQTSKLLLSTSEGISDPDLKTALKRLAKRGNSI